MLAEKIGYEIFWYDSSGLIATKDFNEVPLTEIHYRSMCLDLERIKISIKENDDNFNLLLDYLELEIKNMKSSKIL